MSTEILRKRSWVGKNSGTNMYMFLTIFSILLLSADIFPGQEDNLKKTQLQSLPQYCCAIYSITGIDRKSGEFAEGKQEKILLL